MLRYCSRSEPVDDHRVHDSGNREGRNGSYKLAIADYSNAIEIDSVFAEAHYDGGFSFYESRRNEEAIAVLTRAIELNPKRRLVLRARFPGRPLHRLHGAGPG